MNNMIRVESALSMASAGGAGECVVGPSSSVANAVDGQNPAGGRTAS